jgi:hypothetical protein
MLLLMQVFKEVAQGAESCLKIVQLHLRSSLQRLQRFWKHVIAYHEFNVAKTTICRHLQAHGMHNQPCNHMVCTINLWKEDFPDDLLGHVPGNLIFEIWGQMMLVWVAGWRRSKIAQITTSLKEGSKGNGVERVHAPIIGLKRDKMAKKLERLGAPSTEPTVEASPVISLVVILVGQLVNTMLQFFALFRLPRNQERAMLVHAWADPWATGRFCIMALWWWSRLPR